MRNELIAAGLLLIVLVSPIMGLRYLDSTYRMGEKSLLLTAQEPSKGGWQPRLIRARVGQTVRLRLTSRDVTHGFLLPAFGIKTRPISPGEFVTVEFIPDRTGTFTFYCYVLCGPRHGAMNGRIVVEE